MSVGPKRKLTTEERKALNELPTAYAVALRMQAAGSPEAAIADALAVPLSGLQGVIELAEAKLAAILALEPGEI